MLTVKNIKMSYEGEHLLRDVSFTVNPEEVVCLLGASGSGKSTLLRIIAGLEDPEDGDVLWDGKSLTGVPTHERRFGLMFQDYALFPHRNVAENIAFGLHMQNQSKQDVQKRVLEALKTIDMPGFANRKVTELSGGEQQRVALARALAPQPRLLMLDEPLGALDRNLREQLSHELRRILRESKIPAIYVTHDQDEAFAIADRLLLLHNGVILQSGKPEEFYHHPRNAWVASFFGLGNLIPGKVVEHFPLKVKTPIGILRASCDRQPPEIGQWTTLLLRPAQAFLGQEDSGNRITGQVIDRVFQGETYRLSLFCNQEAPSFDITLPKPFEIGQSLTVNYRTEDVLCLENETGKP